VWHSTDTFSADEARIFKNDKHTGPVRGVDFNSIQRNLMLTGAVNAEVCLLLMMRLTCSSSSSI
jgi:hypothetical protein